MIFSFVNKTSTAGSGVTSATITPGWSLAAGDILVVAVAIWDASAAVSPSVSDSAGNNYRLDASYANQANNGNEAFLFRSNIIHGGSGNQITVSFGGQNCPYGLSVIEYSFGGTLSVDGTASSQSNTGSSTTINPGTLSLSGSGELVVMLGVPGLPSETYTPASGFTVETSGTINGTAEPWVYQDNLSNSGNVTPSVTISSGSKWAAAAVAYKATGIANANPASVATNSSSVTIALTGANTSWSSGGTIFTVAGAGTTKISQSVSSTTSATLTISTGSTTGTATISDGTYSIALSVASPAVAVSPSSAVAAGTYSITLTGTATLWSSPTGLFTISGISGASISNIAVQSCTQATATLALGSSFTGGTAVITDTSTGQTANVTVKSVYVGSLHCAGKGVLQHTGGTLGLLSNKSAASLSFFLQINSNAGLNLTTGTQIISWASGSGGVTYFPATQTLTLTIGGQSGAVCTTVPIQLGIGYHFMVSWQSGSQVIYLNGLSYATGSLSVNTASYSGIQIGSNPGGSVATDHYISDLAIWGSYAATAADAAALTARTSTPLRLSTAASAWWPLGGGTVGTVPSISDVWFSDFSGNGNTLTVVTGSLGGDAYGPNVAIESPISIVAEVVKSGKLAIFGAFGATPVANGAYPPAVLLAVNATPTIYRNGSAIQIGAPTWTPTSLDQPFVAYLLQCGSVENVAINNGGAGYTSTPSVSVSNTGTGGSGLALGTPVLSSGVTSYTITRAGSGYAQPPAVNFSGGGGSGAAAYAIVWGGRVVQVVVTGGGSGYTSAPTVSIASGAATAVATISGGAVTGVQVTAPGSGYSSGPTVTIAAPSKTSGPAGNIAANAIAIVYDSNAGASAGSIRAIVPFVGGLLGCGSGYSSGSPPAVTVAAPGSGTTATATAVVTQYVSNIPVTAGGSNYNSPPTITLSGGNPTTQATVAPIMSGPSASDTITYSAPASWLSARIGGNQVGGLQAVTGATVHNWTGQFEGGGGALAAFAQTPTMLAGANHGSVPGSRSAVGATFKNRLRGAFWWSVGSGNGVITYQADGNTPASWTYGGSTTIQVVGYGPNWGNMIDSMGSPSQPGQWTLQYDDPYVNTGTASACWMNSALDASNLTITPVSLSGSGASFTATESGGAVTGFTQVSGGSGYQGAVVVLSGGGGGGAIAAPIISGGVITGIQVVLGGSGYTSAPTVAIYGTKVSGTAVTSVWDVEYIATTTPGTGPTEWDPSLAFNVANAAGTWNIGNPWMVGPNVATRAAVASIDRTRMLAVDDNVITALTGTTGRHPAPCGSWMPRRTMAATPTTCSPATFPTSPGIPPGKGPISSPGTAISSMPGS